MMAQCAHGRHMQKEQDGRSFVPPSVLHCCLSSTDPIRHEHELSDDSTKKEEVETIFHKISAAVSTHAGSAVVCRQNCGSACA
jgi:hypothetical protein